MTRRKPKSTVPTETQGADGKRTGRKTRPSKRQREAQARKRREGEGLADDANVAMDEEEMMNM